jgi:hypothetical protein
LTVTKQQAYYAVFLRSQFYFDIFSEKFQYAC